MPDSPLLPVLFGTAKPLIGMVHLLPLPGSPRWGGSMNAVLDRAAADAHRLAEAGVDGVMVENYSDTPFYPTALPPETLAALAVAAREVVREIKLPVGVNALRNDALGAVAAAVAAGARFVRINVHTGVMATDQGLLSGAAHETLRLRAYLHPTTDTHAHPLAIFADVWVKHATPLPGADLAQAAEDTYHRGGADALIVSGSGTGKPTDLTRVKAVREAVPTAPILLGSGVTAASAAAMADASDGAIVGSAMQWDGLGGNPVDPDRACCLVAAWRAARGE